MPQVLVDGGATIELQDALGRSALMFAAGSDATAACRILLEAQASLSVRDRRGRAALDYAPAGACVCVYTCFKIEIVLCMCVCVCVRACDPLQDVSAVSGTCIDQIEPISRRAELAQCVFLLVGVLN